MVVEKDANILPFDIERIILLKLPVKSLLRFKTLCKSWNALISDHDFAINHHQQSKTSRNQNFFLLGCSTLDDEYCLVKFENKRFQVELRREYRLVKFENNRFQVEAIREYPHCGKLVCYADGLALLRMTFFPTSYVLWDLLSKQETLIIRVPHAFDLYWTCFGLCSSPTLDDYKIVARYAGYYAVYSCKNKVWTEEKEFPYRTCLIIKGGLSVDGICFWSWPELGGDRDMEIFYFDPSDETFKKLKKPRIVMGSFYLTSLKGSLCLYQNRTSCGTRGLRIWIMRDRITNVDSNSWTELMNIDEHVFHKLGPSNFISPLFFTEKNELVIRLDNEKSNLLGIYNYVERKFENIDDPASLIYFKYSEIVPCGSIASHAGTRLGSK